MHKENPENPIPKGYVETLELHNNTKHHERDRKAFIWGTKRSKQLSAKIGFSENNSANKFKYAINLIDGAGICREAYSKFSWHWVS